MLSNALIFMAGVLTCAVALVGLLRYVLNGTREKPEPPTGHRKP